MTIRIGLISQKYNSLPLAAKAALWFTICSFLLNGLGFITGPIFTRLLSPEEYGIVTLYMTYQQIMLIFATWEIQYGAFQKGLFKYERDWDQYSQSTVLLINLLTVVFFILVLIFYRPIAEFTRMSSLSITLLFLYLITTPAYVTFLTKKRTKYDYKIVVILMVLFTLLNIFVAIGAIFLLGRTAQVRYNASLVVSIVIFVYFYINTVFHKGVKFRWSEVKPQWVFMLSFQAPLVLHSLSYLVLGQADRVMIGKMVGDSQAAFYGVAYALASAITVLQSSINEAMTPWRYQKLKEGDYGVVGSTTNMVLVILGAAILLFILIAPEIMNVLFTSDYYEAVWSIPPVSISVYFMFLYSSFVSVEAYYEKTRYIMYVSVFCGVLNIVLNYLLIPVWGYIVCGYTTLLSYIIFAVLHYLFMKHVCKKEISGNHIFSFPIMAAISFCVVLLSIVFTLIYPYRLIRYVILIGMLISVWYFRDRIKMITQMIKMNY